MLRRPFSWLVPILLVFLVAAFAWYKLSPKEIEVVVAPVEHGTVEKIVANTRAGTLKACRQANLSTSIGGQISVLNVKNGDRVKKGQLLLELWNKDLVAEVALAATEVRAAEAREAAARLQSEISHREAARLQRLFQSEGVSESAIDKAVTEAAVHFASYEAAQASVLTSRARVAVIKANLDRTRLLAPFAGIIAKINGELNEYVTPSPPGIATPPTVELLDTTCFYVTAPIDEVDAAAVRVGMTARVSMDAFGDRYFAAKVSRIAPYVLDREKQARTVEIEVEFTAAEAVENLLAGYSADVEIVLEEHKDTLYIPTQAVLEGNRVFVYDRRQRRLQKRDIKPGIANWDRTEVLEGLKADELVVTSIDQPDLKDGSRADISEGQ
ncbi:MAG: efflux RND transporter periplasmic adaptor subunit [Desulfobulbaceae bacterium]|nr:efflux RND transporter periplasmic adaptor subunit [Desulfobulbaceae bacterium]